MKKTLPKKTGPLFRAFCALAVPAVLAVSGCGGPSGQDPEDQMAALAGVMSREKDLQDVRFDDLDGDGVREVILVFGQKPLLNFDVYSAGQSGKWIKTPLVSDRDNPREFVNTRLDSIRDTDSDKVMELRVSSRLYDGSLMVKELHWSANGYAVVAQRTEQVQVARVPQSAPQAEATAKAKPAAPAPEEKPKPKPIPPETPSVGTYQVKKGDSVIGLARALGVPVEQLESLNGDQVTKRPLRISQIIKVPVPPRSNKNFQVRIEKERYTVKPGDSLTSIASQYETTVRAIKSWNHGIPEDGTIKAGQVILIHQAQVDISS